LRNLKKLKRKRLKKQKKKKRKKKRKKISKIFIKMKSIILIGHKNPDTDSVVAPLVFAEFLKKVKEHIIGFRDFKIRVGRGGEVNKETEFVLDHFKQKRPPLIKSLRNKEVFLVDHGDYAQAVDGIREANILGVLDHHKLGGIKTDSPIFCRAEPLGSSSSLVAKMFYENNIPLSRKSAGLLLAGLVSDTLNLTSPTTTKQDKNIASDLAKISGENRNKLAEKMFEAKSDIAGISPKELVSKDYKEFKEGKTKFGLGVWETTSPNKVKNLKEKIFPALEKLKKQRKLDLAFFALIDIVKKNSLLFVLGEKERIIAEKAFKKKEKQRFVFLPGVVSRKKQMIPEILKQLR